MHSAHEHNVLRHAAMTGYDSLSLYVGDIHSHCGISYGHGTIEDAYRNARLQLDFASVTGHAYWPDMPEEPRLVGLRRYHEDGFARLAEGWDLVQDVTEQVHENGKFVTFLSHEWHSMAYGDHCIYYCGSKGPILRPATLDELRGELRGLAAAGIKGLAIPHHIGYAVGHRGINWDAYSEEFSPVVEMMSMHGCGESPAAPRPYLHTMGPRDGRSTAYHGLDRGYAFGFIGSTDHHSAHPGSHGYGRLAVWAPELSREGVWEAIVARRAYALTGDRIVLATDIDGAIMGSVVPPNLRRRITVEAAGLDELDYLELVRNGSVIHRTRPAATDSARVFTGSVSFTVGWGEVDVPTVWDVRLEVVGGRLVCVEPRLHGVDVVAPADELPERFSFSDVMRESAGAVRLRTTTSGNPNVSTDATQALVLRVEGDDSTRLVAEVNGLCDEYTIGELRRGARTGFVGGFNSAAFAFGRAVPDALLSTSLDVIDDREGSRRDWYQARVRQVNDQWAWSSPTWVSAS